MAIATRYESVDVIRGLTVAAMLLVNNPGDWGHVWWPLEHAEWNGCTPTDIIFPLFLFIVGVSIALSIVPRVEAGSDRRALRRAAWLRSLRIIGLGVLLNAIAWLTLPDVHMRLPGVLQRIGICFAATAILAIYANRLVRDIVVVVLLSGYGVLLLYGGMAPWTNPVSQFDTAVFGSFVYAINPLTGQGHDPEGLLATLPALATTLLGVRAGMWLRMGAMRPLLIMAALGLAGGWLLQPLWPFNKNLWTPGYVLWTAGWSFALLAVFHQLVDVRGWHLPGRAFGLNAIAAYGGSDLMVYLLIGTGMASPLYRWGFASWITPMLGPYVASAAWGVAFVAVWWAITGVMARRGLYLKL